MIKKQYYSTPFPTDHQKARAFGERKRKATNELTNLRGEAAVEGGGDEMEPSIGVSLVGPVEVPRVEVVEEDRRAAPDPRDRVQPPARQAEHPVPVAFGLRCAVAHKDEPRRRGSGSGGGGSRGRGGAGVVLRRRLRWRARPLARRGGKGRRGGPRHGGGRRMG